MKTIYFIGGAVLLVFLYLAYRVVRWLLSDDTAAVQHTAANLPAPAPAEDTALDQAATVGTGVAVAASVAEIALDEDAIDIAADGVDVAADAVGSIFDLFT